MRHFPGVLDQVPEKNCWVPSVKWLAMVWRGSPAISRSGGCDELSTATGWVKSMTFMPRSMAPNNDVDVGRGLESRPPSLCRGTFQLLAREAVDSKRISTLRSKA